MFLISEFIILEQSLIHSGLVNCDTWACSRSSYSYFKSLIRSVHHGELFYHLQYTGSMWSSIAIGEHGEVSTGTLIEGGGISGF